tara:strand:- start:17645 stop:18463 length:819 start_codon:yes stop_codon:yes gene_type:complete
MESFLLNIDPVAFSIGPLTVRWYALAYLCGFLLGWKYCLVLVNRSTNARPNAEDIDNFLTWAVVGVILGGRLGYILFYNFELYSANPLEILKIWHGGMSFHGGMMGVLVAMFLFSKKNKINVFSLADIVSAAAPIGLFFGRIANFINAELYGRQTDLPWGVVFPGGGDAPRHPSQLYEALLEGAVLFLILYGMSKCSKVQARLGMVAGAFLLGYGVFRAIVEFVREPDAQIGLIGDAISMGQILCLPMIIGGAILIYCAWKGKLASRDPISD